MALNLHLLRIFTVVAEHGSLSRGAAAMHISQPAVTKGIQELEKQVGVPLLERGARGVRLTEAGAACRNTRAPSSPRRARPKTNCAPTADSPAARCASAPA